MGSAVFFDAERAKAIEDKAINGGLVDVNGNLILTTHDGTEINAGSVKGPKGDSAQYMLPNNTSTNTPYIRLVTLEGYNASNGAHWNALISGLGNFGRTTRGTILLHATQRGDNIISVRAWAWDLPNNVLLYTKQISTFAFEIWMRVPPYQTRAFATELANWNTARNFDSLTTMDPTGLVSVNVLRADPNYASAAETAQGTIPDKSVTPAGMTEVLNPQFKEINRSFRLLEINTEFTAEPFDILTVLNGDWRNYSDLVTSMGAIQYSDPKAFLSKNGWVTMRGLLRKPTAAGANDLVFTLPPGFRPEATSLFLCYIVNNSAMAPVGVKVSPNGEVRLLTAVSANVELSVAGIVFNVNSYSPLTLTSPWTAYDSGTFGAPSVYMTPDKVGTFRGAVQGGTLGNTAFNTSGSFLPAGIVGNEVHMATANSSGGFSYANMIMTDGAYRPRVSIPAHLSGNVYLGSGYAKTRRPPETFINSWANYGGAFPGAQATKTEDDMVILNGLMRAGTFGQPAFTLPPTMRPKRTVIRVGTANDAFARIDIDPSGGVKPVTGVASGWVSLDGIMFAAEQ